MIGQNHQVARPQVGTNASGGGRENQVSRPPVAEARARGRSRFRGHAPRSNEIGPETRRPARRRDCRETPCLHVRRRSCAENAEFGRKERSWARQCRSASSFRPEPRTTASRGGSRAAHEGRRRPPGRVCRSCEVETGVQCVIGGFPRYRPRGNWPGSRRARPARPAVPDHAGARARAPRSRPVECRSS